jgi:cytochrome c oxidase subunit 2
MNGLHDALSPAGPQATALFNLWNVMLVVCAIVFAFTMAALAVALRRAPRVTERSSPDLGVHPRKDAALARRVAWGVAGSSVLLLVLLLATFFTDRALSALPLDGAVHIDLIAHRFWWEARYEAHDPALAFTTANELHVPAGRTVLVRLRSFDVIHSLWIPSLTGKKDLIPGRESMLAFRADKPGMYRGQCAEFCGYQHAHMALVVIADAPADFDRWLALQRQPAPAPASALDQRGLRLFEQGTCAMCHAIGGTQAAGRSAPDLTHFAGRTSIGAGTLENTPAARTEWIADVQKFKPGADMPPLAMSADDLVAIASYLGTLR